MFSPEPGAPNRKLEQEAKPETRVFFIRHSKATYVNYAEKVGSDSPESRMDIEAQSPDLVSAGIELAKEKAREFFSNFDSSKDVIYIVSSSEMRALETAKIYADTARAFGIEVIQHEKTGTGVADYVGEGDVRSIDTISLDIPNQILPSVFNPPAYMPKINWEKVSPETKSAFDEAYKIILADDRGSWGANFAAHAEEVKKIIPSIETGEELYETQFRNMQRLASFARKKSSGTKRVNVLAFGHENYMSVALEKYTGNHAVGNVEAIEVLEDGALRRTSNER